MCRNGTDRALKEGEVIILAPILPLSPESASGCWLLSGLQSSTTVKYV